MVVYRYTYDSPIGVIYIGATKEAVIYLSVEPMTTPGIFECTNLILETIKELEEYFEGKRQEFTVPLKPAGTAFQQQVWQVLKNIPFGKTCTYGQIAQMIGHPKACRAVGNANHHNPILIMIPCHRVIGAKGQLTGYRGGLGTKLWLLNHEAMCIEE